MKRCYRVLGAVYGVGAAPSSTHHPARLIRALMLPILYLLSILNPDHAAADNDQVAAGCGASADAAELTEIIVRARRDQRAVELCPGEIRVTSPVIVNLMPGERFVLQGAPSAMSTRLTGFQHHANPSSWTGLLTIRGGEEVRIERINIEVYPEKPTAPTLLDGLRIEGARRVYIAETRVMRAPGWGIFVRGADRVEIVDSDSSMNIRGGLGIESSDHVTVRGGIYSDNGLARAGVAYGYGVAASSGRPSNRKIVISGVVAERNYRKGLDVHAGEEVIISGNVVEGFGASGVYAVNEGCAKQVRNVLIADNIIRGGPLAGLDATQISGPFGIDIGAFTPRRRDGSVACETTFSGAFVVSGNLISGLAGYGRQPIPILVRNPSSPSSHPPAQVVIDGNTIFSGVSGDSAEDAAIVVEGTPRGGAGVSTVTVSNNQIDVLDAEYGIRILGARRTVVVGNTLTARRADFIRAVDLIAGQHYVAGNLVVGPDGPTGEAFRTTARGRIRGAGPLTRLRWRRSIERRP